MILLAAADHDPRLIILSQFLAFGILAFFIIKFGVPVLRKALAARSQEVADTFQRLERETQEAAARIDEFKRRLAGIDEESKKRIQAALDEGAKAKALTLEEAHAQAAAELQKAKQAIGIERDKAVLELRFEVGRATLLEAMKSIDGQMTPELNRKMVDRYLDGMEAAARRR
jgi:F-type H+-transporting ATPase subunit b